MLELARKDILNAHNGKKPRILDPFGGGGSIPLEALRLGCEVYSNDYNPVAVVIQKCTLEYPKGCEFRKSEAIEGHSKKGLHRLDKKQEEQLLDDIQEWGNWILHEATQEIGKYYTSGSDQVPTIGYFWARTIPCQNPVCKAGIPLIRQYWLSKKKNKKVSLHPVVIRNIIKFKVVGTGYDELPKTFNPDKGTISKAVATCLACGSVVDAKTTVRLFKTNQAGQRLMAVVQQTVSRSGKKYRIATEEDVLVFHQAAAYLEKKRKSLKESFGMDPVPDESLPPAGTLGFNVQRYNMNTWGDLFNSRQKLALITLVDKIREASILMKADGYTDEYSRIVTTYLAMVLNKLVDWNSSFATWITASEAIGHTFTRQALPMVWDYFETNVMSAGLSDWAYMIKGILPVVNNCSKVSDIGEPSPTVGQDSATELPWPDNFFDAILTDPPYYNNVPYSHLSDFFYVWLKRTIGHMYPELFSTPLAPKSKEIVAYPNMEGGWDAAKHFFEEMLKRSFQEIYRVLKPDGIAVIVYAHKSTAAWETLLNSLLDSGLVVTAAWPINTEMKGRLRALESAVLASSIYIVARKLKREKIGFYREIKEELRKHLGSKLDSLWQEGIAGADFFISAIGFSIEIFGRFERIIDDQGNVIRGVTLLDVVRSIVTNYAVHKILHNGFGGEISEKSRFYLLWRWSYGEKNVPFDDARKLAQSVGIDLSHEWNRKESFIQKNGELVRVLGPEERIQETSQSTEFLGSSDLIDVLHRSLLLWQRGKKEELLKLLSDSGFGKSDVFYSVAQAISETLSDTSREKKLLDGFLAGKLRVSGEVSKGAGQTRLFE